MELGRSGEQGDWLDVELLAEGFKRLQGYVSLAAFEAAEVGPVYAELVGERLLAEASAMR